MNERFISKQPVGRLKGIPQYKSGGPKSVNKLKVLNFDPIEELVSKYKKLEAELEYHEKVREGSIVPLTPTGKVRSYDSETHMNVYDKLLKVSESLLRYRYGRVPETVNFEDKTVPPLIINLDKSGSRQLLVNDSEDGDYDDDNTA